MKNKKIIFAFILGGLIFGSIGVYAATKYQANQVIYKNNKTVEDALNDLYKNKSEYKKGYGVRRQINSSSTAWERIELSKGLVANAQTSETAVKNDFDSIYPWSDIKSYNYDTGTKQITAWYGDKDFTLKTTGDVEVLTYIPEFYYSRYQRNGYEYVLISKEAIDGYTKSDAFSIGRYTISADKNGDTITRVHSRSDEDPLVSKTITNFRTYAKNIGMQQLDYHYFIIQLLYLVEYADYNSQAKLGVGNTNNSVKLPSGGCDKLGMKSGTLNNDGKHSMIYRGIENIYGNIWQFVDGINIKDRVAYISYDPSKYAVDKFNDGYSAVGYTNASTTNFVSKLGYDSNNQLVAFPIEASGTDSTYISDYYSQSTGNVIALVGGRYSNGTNAGLWYWTIQNASSNIAAYCGARLLKLN